MKKRLILAAAIGITAIPPAKAQLVINELMQSNIDCIIDDLNEFPDSWVELYNTSDTPVDLGDYKIGLSENAGKAYQLPSRTVGAHSFVVVYCDKADKDLHTDFRLDSGKGACVYLIRDGVTVDKIEGLKKQPAPNVAYGRQNEASDNFGYQITPTPGKANCGTLTKDILPEPIFSRKGCVQSEAFTLTLSLPEGCPEATIRYTLDGSEPTAGSQQYTKPIQIRSTSTVRAKIMAYGYLSPRSTTHSYIFHPRDSKLPVVSIVTNSAYFYDQQRGIYVQGKDPNNPNYRHDWRRPINLEIFMEDGQEAAINQLCETRVKGGATRDLALKSLALYANKRFGTKRFDYEFFPDDAPRLTDWKSIELRNSGNDFDYLYFRDALIQRTMGRHTDLDWQPYRPAIVYINGQYKGMLNMRSRSNEDLIYTLYNGLEDIDMVENWWELKEGKIDNFNRFVDFYTQQGHTYEEFEEWMDVEEFANLMIMNTFFDNKDFPANNIVCWRPRAEGGKWRWVAKDTDFGLGLYGASAQYRTLDWIYDNQYDQSNTWGNTPDGTRLFRRLMATDRFKNMYIDRCAVYIGDFMNPKVVGQYLDEMSGAIAKEYPSHRALFNPWWPTYSTELANARQWITARATFFPSYLAEYFGLGKPCPLTIDPERSDEIRLTVNNTPLNYRSFEGKFFAGRTLAVSGTSEDASQAITGWNIEIINKGTVTSMHYEGATLSIEMPQCDRMVVTSTVAAAGINDVINYTDSDSVDMTQPLIVYDLAGRDLGTYTNYATAANTLGSGLYILRQGHKAMKVKMAK